MKQKCLWLLVGAPGSGKSTWAKQQNGVWISRDNIRFSMFQDGDHYFDRENDVYNAFVAAIQNALDTSSLDVYADASHLNWNSRAKLLNRLNLQNVIVNAVIFTTPLNICFERNDIRTGHAHVPHNVIRRMYHSFKHPNTDPFHYGEIKEI